MSVFDVCWYGVIIIYSSISLSLILKSRFYILYNGLNTIWLYSPFNWSISIRVCLICLLTHTFTAAKTADTTQVRRPPAVTFPDICSLVRCAAAECERPIPPNPDEGKCCYTCPRQTSRTGNIHVHACSHAMSSILYLEPCKRLKLVTVVFHLCS